MDQTQTQLQNQSPHQSRPQPLDRITGRVLVLDRDGRVLLFQGFDPAEPDRHRWFTPGGGLEPGETPREAAARELLEETGLAVEPEALGEPVFQDLAEFSFDGVPLRQHNHFYRLHTEPFEVSVAGFDDIEQRTHLGYRWWSAEELSQTADIFFPVELPGLLTPDAV
jgi:8-oxo-dGTP pyrophosphatase MutT (NUDIX family)